MATAAIAGSVGCFGVVGCVVLGKRSVVGLGKDDQIRVEGVTETVVYNGPGVKFISPFRKSIQRVKAFSLGPMDYLKVKDSLQGKVRVERGPSLVFLGAYDKNEGCGTSQGITLDKREYIFVEDQVTGIKVTVKGPTVWFPQAYEIAGPKRTATSLKADEYLRLKDEATGQRWVVKGQTLLFLEPTWKIEGGVMQAWTLKAYEYVRLLDTVTGKITVHRGEKTVFPGPDEELLDADKMAAIDLKVNEYVKIQDQTDGKIRVVAGTAQVFMEANEKVLDGGKKQAIQVDDENAVLVRDTSSGQLRLVTDNKLFVPGPNEKIEKVQSLIKLADHEAVIVKDKMGQLHFHYGNAEKATSSDCPRSFFLQPYSELVQLWWSSGLRRAKRDLCIERFDCRAQYMWFEFDCRTSDNVELVLEATFFWEVMDLARMVRNTGNLPGDIYNQARSQFIKSVARVTLKSFMDELHTISKSIFDADQGFYEKRGVKIHSMEVTRYSCAEQRTSEVLQQIIEETTNRLNRLSQAESENEVKLYKMQGQIAQEELNGKLLEIQHEHQQTESRVQGKSEAERVAAFMEGLTKQVPKLEDRLNVWSVLRKNDALSAISEGTGTSLYYTPNDVDLSIATKQAAQQ